jgi:phage shock protein A
MSKKFVSGLKLELQLTPEARNALRKTYEAYQSALQMLDRTEGANLVVLHQAFYEEIRKQTGLPSRLATLALRDHGSREAVRNVEGMPLDSKLYAIKGPDSLSVATLLGRVVIPYAVIGYQDGWSDFAEARLVFSGSSICLYAGTHASSPSKKEGSMSSEGILARLGRVIAGVVNDAVDAAEASNPTAVAQQAVREIGAIAEEARTALGIAMAAGHRLKAKAKDLDAEISDLDEKIKVGLESGREDLARAAAGVQLDIEAQRDALSQAILENERAVAEAEATLRSIASARADAMKRLEDAKRAERKAATPVSPSQRNDQRLADALNAVERVTGVPANVSRPGGAEVEELGRLQRQKAIEARLNAFQQGER